MSSLLLTFSQILNKINDFTTANIRLNTTPIIHYVSLSDTIGMCTWLGMFYNLMKHEYLWHSLYLILRGERIIAFFFQVVGKLEQPVNCYDLLKIVYKLLGKKYIPLSVSINPFSNREEHVQRQDLQKIMLKSLTIPRILEKLSLFSWGWQSFCASLDLNSRIISIWHSSVYKAFHYVLSHFTTLANFCLGRYIS